MDHNTLHIPVLLQESIDSLNLKPGMKVVDCTVNRAGHATEIAKVIGKNGKLIIFDLDKVALSYATEKLSSLPNAPTIIPIHSNYRNIKSELEKVGVSQVDAIFADLGLSSQELDVSGRGFSFRYDEPLIMTFQSEVTPETFTAKDLVSNLSAESLAQIFKSYGDETQAYKIAKKIVEMREVKEIDTTQDLVDAVIAAVGKKPWQKTHPATKIFQAIRIAVNDEYEGVKQLLIGGFEILRSEGRFSIITFHSGEDRIVKEFFKNLYEQRLTTKPVKTKPADVEIKRNPRSRSAILRQTQKK